MRKLIKNWWKELLLTDIRIMFSNTKRYTVYILYITWITDPRQWRFSSKQIKTRCYGLVGGREYRTPGVLELCELVLVRFLHSSHYIKSNHLFS